MIKYYLKFRNAIKKDKNLTLEEGYMLELIYDYYNVSVGYAYPSYEVLMSDLKTKRKAKVSKLLKSLVNKGYIEINKVGKKNTYKLLKYLFLSQPVDSDGNKPIDGQVHYAATTKDETKVIDVTGFNGKQVKNLLETANENVEKVINAFNYAVSRGANNVYAYTSWIIKNGIGTVKTEFKTKVIPFIDGCSSRNYSEDEWDSIEKRLLGWR